MANSYTFRSGQRELRKFPVASATVIEIGDMLWFAASDAEVKPASDYDWDGTLATTQTNFANTFAGIAYEQSASGDTDDISVDLSADSVYQFAVASATYEIGDVLGPDESPANNLADQTLEGCSTTARACARAFERAGSAVTQLRVKFASAYNVAANNVNAVVG